MKCVSHLWISWFAEAEELCAYLPLIAKSQCIDVFSVPEHTLRFRGTLELLQKEGGGGCTPYVCVCVFVFLLSCLYKSDVHLCLFMNLSMCPHMWPCVQWISNVRWKHMRFDGGEDEGLPCFDNHVYVFGGWEVGGVCLCARECLRCFWHPHRAGTSDSSPATWSIIYLDKTEHSPEHSPAHDLPTRALGLKGKEQDVNRQSNGVRGGAGGREQGEKILHSETGTLSEVWRDYGTEDWRNV